MEETKEAKVYNLVLELEGLKKEKSATVKGFNEEIKRINAEIKDILKDETETE